MFVQDSATDAFCISFSSHSFVFNKVR